MYIDSMLKPLSTDQVYNCYKDFFCNIQIYCYRQSCVFKVTCYQQNKKGISYKINFLCN